MRAVRFSDRHIDAPIRDGVLLERRFPHGPGRRSVPHTNVPHLVATHGLPGYEWGYEGSGPLDFAPNIAELAVRQLEIGTEPRSLRWGYCYHESAEVTEKLLRAFIAPAPRDGCAISWDEILAFVESSAADVTPAH